MSNQPAQLEAQSVEVPVRDTSIHVEHVGQGADVLLIAGLGDPLEAWEAQILDLQDDHRLIAYDNRGTGRTPLPDSPLSVATFAEDAAAVLAATSTGPAHVMGFSGGSAIAQELALRRPDVVRSLVLCSTWGRADAYFTNVFESWRWMADRAPDPGAFLRAFFVWIYTARAHADGTVDEIVTESLAFEHAASVESLQRSLDALAAHDTLDRLHEITVPTLVVAGGQDIATPPRLGRAVADAIPGARFELLDDQAHQPFQEQPEVFNRLVREFWKQATNP